MKKLIIASILAVTVITSAFAGSNEKLNFKGSDKFLIDFPKASNINYKVTTDYTQVSFVLNGEQVKAFYNPEGNLTATAKNISLDKLPAGSLAKIQNKYSTAIITEAIEMNHEDNGLNYYVSLQNGTKKVVLEVSTNGAVSVFK